jgi:hypothetical protein
MNPIKLASVVACGVGLAACTNDFSVFSGDSDAGGADATLADSTTDQASPDGPAGDESSTDSALEDGTTQDSTIPDGGPDVTGSDAADADAGDVANDTGKDAGIDTGIDTGVDGGCPYLCGTNCVSDCSACNGGVDFVVCLVCADGGAGSMVAMCAAATPDAGCLTGNYAHCPCNNDSNCGPQNNNQRCSTGNICTACGEPGFSHMNCQTSGRCCKSGASYGRCSC